MDIQSAPARNGNVAIIPLLPLLFRKTRRRCSNTESNGRTRAAKSEAHRKQDKLAEYGAFSLAVLEHLWFPSLPGPF
jgi:hypothetical protein